jgi:hypothetical protein
MHAFGDFINACSIICKGLLVQDLITTNFLDILAVAETWIVDDDSNAVRLDSVPDGYCIIHAPRSSATRHSRGGGLCLIYRCESDCTVLNYGSLECLLLRSYCSQLKHSEVVDLVIVYRPPSSNLATFYDDLSNLFDRMGDSIDRDQFICCGDFNCGGSGRTSITSEMPVLLNARGL